MIVKRLGLAACTAAACAGAALPSAGSGSAGTAEQPLAREARPRSESFVAVSPRDPRHVVASVMEFGGSVTDPVGFAVRTGHAPRAHVYVSRDGGRTYAGTGVLPGPDGARGSTLDQTLAFDPRGGPLYAGYLAYHEESKPVESDRGGVWVARSDDGGRTWRGTSVGRPARLAGGGCRAADKPVIAVDARGWVHAVWQSMEASDCSFLYEAKGLAWSRSTDGGRTWSRPVELDGVSGWAPSLAPLPDGTLAVAYGGFGATDASHPECGGEWATVHVARVSPNGDTEVAPALPYVCTTSTVTRNGTGFRAQEIPSMTYEPRSRSLVVASPDLRAADEGLAIATSRDGGRSWKRGRIPAEPGFSYTHAQLANGGGAVAVSYLANAPGGTYLPTLRASRDGGRTWSGAVALASTPSVGAQRFTPPGVYNPVDPYGLGHYQGLAVGRDGVAHATWPDLRPRADVHDVDTWVRAVPLPR